MSRCGMAANRVTSPDLPLTKLGECLEGKGAFITESHRNRLVDGVWILSERKLGER